MPEYTRPAINAREFRDESGAPIRYGARWTGSPPDDSYSRVSNPDRFAPLQTIADALIEHLRATYRVDVAPLAKSATTKVVAVTPKRADAAPLLFRFTDFPGIEVRAGVRCSLFFPRCGCDACDETWEDKADELEGLVFAVTDGTFSERIAPTSDGMATVGYSIRPPGRTGISGGSLRVAPDSGLRADAARLDSLPLGCWQPWNRKSKAQSPS
jgi:Family of unknown function (DUF6226)